MPEERDQDRRIMAAVSRLLRIPPGEREHYVALVADGDADLQREILETLYWEEQMGAFLQQPVTQLTKLNPRMTAGQVISDRFEILRAIGEGGMGIVYEAFDRKRQHKIAIKCAKPGCANFLKPELQGALKVRHPNVCLVNEIHTACVEEQSIDFLTMELLEGEPLAPWLAREKQFSFRILVAITAQLCSGLAEAHRCGVIHRDLKSANIMLCPQPDHELRVVIMDFGLASESSETQAEWGTPAYMAPELWRDAKTSKASDIYALGVLLHEMLAAYEKQANNTDSRSRQRTIYRTFADELVNINPKRRYSAFDSAPSLLNRVKNQRNFNPRQVLAQFTWPKTAITAAGLLGLGCGLLMWLSEPIRDYFHPLPGKRFVAVLNESDHADLKSLSLGSSITNDIESELVRAERGNRNLFVISTKGLNWTGEKQLINQLRTSFGVNLVLTLVSQLKDATAHIELKLLDVTTKKVLRTRQLDCSDEDCRSLNVRVVQTAASMLSISPETLNKDRLRPATGSLMANIAFQQAEELRAEPNDKGLYSAIEQYKKAVEADPQYPIAHAELARAYCRLYGMRGDPSVLQFARLNAERAISLDGKLPEAHAALAFVYEKIGNEQTALQEIQRALSLDPFDPHILLWEADIYLYFSQWTNAEQAYKRLQVERPNYWLPYQQLGALLSDQGRYAEAKEAFYSATLAAPWSALSFSNLGIILLKLGRVTEAKGNFQRCLSLNPEDDGAHVNLAEALRDEGKYSMALSHLKEAIRINPADDQNWLGLADCYERISPHNKDTQQSYLRAAEKVQQILNTEPLNGSALVRLALYQAKTNSVERSVQLLKRAELAGINDLDSQLTKARVLAVLQRREEAAQTLKSCLKRGATLFEMRSVRDLKSLVGDSGII